MEVKKSNTANLENQRVQGFLLGLIVVLAAMFVALEWNSSDSGWTFFADDEDLEAEMELSPLKRDQDEIPMMLPQEQKAEQPKSEQLNLVDEDVELPPPVEPELMEKSPRWWICTTSPSTSVWSRICRSFQVVPPSS